MKIIVLGAGALGPIVAAHLARAGEDVSLIARGDRATFLRENGITIAGLNEFKEKEKPPRFRGLRSCMALGKERVPSPVGENACLFQHVCTSVVNVSCLGLKKA